MCCAMLIIPAALNGDVVLDVHGVRCAMLLIIPVALNGEVVACGAIVRGKQRINQPE